MKKWKKLAAGMLLMAGLSPQAQAQVPAVPGAAPGIPAAPGAIPAAPGAVPPRNLLSFICMTPEQKAECKEKICNSALGQMLNNGLRPLSAFSGGLVPMCCPEVNAKDLLKPADSAEGAAARAKQDEAEAKARREAVRYLGTLDCNYWPEAQEALVNALRGDRNECVRLEAAIALNRGCCCTKMTIKALLLSVSGSDEDGFPRESSERVRATAHAALAHCLSCYQEIVPVPPDTKDTGKEPIPSPRNEPKPSVKGDTPKSEAKPAGVPDKLPANIGRKLTPAEYYKRVENLSRQQLMEEGKLILSRGQSVAPAQIGHQQSSNNVLSLVAHAFSGPSATPAAAPGVEQAVAHQPVAPVQTHPVRTVSTTTIEHSPALKSVPVAQPITSVKPAYSTPTAPTASRPAVAAPVQPKPYVPTVVPTAAPVAVPATVQPAHVPRTATPVQKATPVHPAQAAQTNQGMTMSLAQVVATLRESPYAEYREWAADNLASVDGWTNTDVVQVLANAARSDNNASVRAACLRTLGRMRVGTMTVLSAVHAAKSDADATVRQEATQALRLIGGNEGTGNAVPK